MADQRQQVPRIVEQIVIPRVFVKFHLLTSNMLEVSFMDILKQLSEYAHLLIHKGSEPSLLIGINLSRLEA